MSKRTIRRGLALLGASAAVAAATALGAAPATAAPAASDGPAVTTATDAPSPKLRAGRSGPSSHKTTGGMTRLYPKDGICEVYSNGYGELCLYWGANFTGSMTDFFYNDANLHDDTFLSAGTGKGSTVANNSLSAFNADAYTTAHVCTDVNYYGSCGYISPATGGNLASTYALNVESLYFG